MQTSSVHHELLALISCLACSMACVARTSSTTAATDVPPVFAERDNVEADVDCPSLIDEPRALFAGRLELGLPVGVTLVEHASDQLLARDSTAICVGGRVIATVTVIERVDDDPSQAIAFVRDQLLDMLALPDRLKIITREEDDAGRRMTSTIRVPAEQGRARPTIILIGLRGGAGRIYAVMFEASPEQFEALLPSFDASLASLRIVE